MNKAFVAILIAASSSLYADELSLMNGRILEDVQIKKIENDQIYFVYEGKIRKVSLDVIKSARVGDKNELVKVEQFQKTEQDRSSGYALKLAYNFTEDRTYEPQVRLYVMEEDEDGTTEARILENRRQSDPSRTYGADEIKSESYTSKGYYFKSKGELVAAQLEIWYLGEKVYDKSLVSTEAVPSSWWKDGKMRSDRLRELEDGQEEEPEVEEDEDDSISQLPFKGKITKVTFSPNLKNRDEILARVDYELSSYNLDSIALPEVRMYQVFEQNGKKEIRSVDFEKDAGMEMRFTRTFIKRSQREPLGDDATYQATLVELNRGVKDLKYWRVELIYEDRVIAARERDFEGYRRQLPEGWWK